jgi:hypothetical protein
MVSARAADPDERRNLVREAVERQDSDLLKKLAAPENVKGLPSTTLVLLGEALRTLGAG